jgi:hypothetical protein
MNTINEVTLQIIYTTESDGQFVANIPIDIISMSKKESCIRALIILFYGKFSFLPDTWKGELFNKVSKDGLCYIPENLNKIPALVKISMCITIPENSNYKFPKWYTECHGKFYFNSGILITDNMESITH